MRRLSTALRGERKLRWSIVVARLLGSPLRLLTRFRRGVIGLVIGKIACCCVSIRVGDAVRDGLFNEAAGPTVGFERHRAPRVLHRGGALEETHGIDHLFVVVEIDITAKRCGLSRKGLSERPSNGRDRCWKGPAILQQPTEHRTVTVKRCPVQRDAEGHPFILAKHKSPAESAEMAGQCGGRNACVDQVMAQRLRCI